MFENQSELRGGDRKHIKVCKRQKSINQQMSYFSPSYGKTTIARIS